MEWLVQVLDIHFLQLALVGHIDVDRQLLLLQESVEREEDFAVSSSLFNVVQPALQTLQLHEQFRA